MSYLATGWFRFDPSRGVDYRILLQATNKNKNEIEHNNNRAEKTYFLHAFRELSLFPNYIKQPMKR